MTQIFRTAERVFEVIRDISVDGMGVTRVAYDVDGAESRAIHFLAGEAIEAGLEVEYDKAKNCIVTLRGEDDTKYKACGSHIDSVPFGGNYDGLAGIVAGLLCLRDFKRKGVVPPRTIKLFILRGEESAWFGRCYIGSSAMLGLLKATELGLVNASCKTLGDAMRDCGADVDTISRGDPLIDVNRVHSFVELHIEQGPVLEEAKRPVGIVSGICGNIRYPVVDCHGEYAHSGATPRRLRRDALMATAELLVSMDAAWSFAPATWRMPWNGRERLTFTAGKIRTLPEAAISKVPGGTRFCLEIRSVSAELMAVFEGMVVKESERIEEKRGVEFDFGNRVYTASVQLDEDVMVQLANICEAEGIEYTQMGSGAGHDAAVFAKAGVPTGMIFVRNQNGSHNPEEAMDMKDFMAATKVLSMYLENES